MKRLLLILILTLSFQLIAKADNIRDLQIEGMSIGDSLLTYFSTREINNYKIKIHNSDRYTTIEINKNLNNYDYLQSSFLKKDVKKKIVRLDGIVNYKNNIDMCYKKIVHIYKEIKNIVPNLNDEGKLTYKHNGDETGESTITDYVLETNKNDEIQIACYDYSKNFSNNNDNLRVGIRLIDFRNFLRNEAYK